MSYNRLQWILSNVERYVTNVADKYYKAIAVKPIIFKWLNIISKKS